MNFNLPFGTIWRQAPTAGKIIISVIGIAMLVTIIYAGLTGFKY